MTFVPFCFCYGQKLKQTYYGVSSDSLYNEHQLFFTSDTTLEISTFARHMSKQFKKTFKYKRIGSKIEVLNNSWISKDSIALSNQGLTQFLSKTTLTKENRAIVDTSAKMVYVLHKDFRKRYYLTYIIDGEAYKQETGLSDAYGLIKNNPKENKALKDKLASLNDRLDSYVVNVYKGLEAYNKFGYESVFGVIEIRRKN